MNIIQLFQDYSIPHATEGHKHCQPGWVNTTCPWCTGNPGMHLGYNLDEDYFHCWRCGWHPINETIEKLIGCTKTKVKEIIKTYGGVAHPSTHEPKVKIRRKAYRLPSGVIPLNAQHRRYLENRHFDPERVEVEWNLLGTGPVSLLDGIDYKHRIIIPIYWDGHQVSFQSRDITGKHHAKYMACPKDRELILHKHILYGQQQYWSDVGICVEGPIDVWRLGVNAFAVSGIEFTRKQVREIAHHFRRVAVVFDDDPQAIVQADKLVAELKFLDVDAWRVDIEGDPGGMSQTDADYLVKTILK